MAIQNRDDETALVETQPGTAGAEISAANDLRCCVQHARRRRRPVIMLVAIGGDNQRKIVQGAKIDGKRTHFSALPNDSNICKLAA